MDLKAHHWVALAIGALGVRGMGRLAKILIYIP
jgi:hypothetical protein